MVIENGSNPDQKQAETPQERVTALADKLAPIEEQRLTAKERANDVGNTGSFKISQTILEEEGSTARMFRVHPVVLVVIGIALAFIAFIAYLIATMPAPPAP